MSETKETTDKTLSVGRKPLSLKRTVESGHVRQSFSHGRSKSVVVEKKKKRTISAPGEGEAQESGGDVGGPGGLSTGEMDARARALQSARELAEQEAQEAAVQQEAQRAREEAERAKAPPPSEAAPATATPAPAAEPAPTAPPVVAKKPEPVRGPIVVLPSADKPKTDLRRPETAAKRKLDAEPTDDDDARTKK
jgi:translation initiation factor IF-2